MNFLEKIIYFFQGEMTIPTVFGWFHLMCLAITFIIIFLFYKFKNKYNEKQLKKVLAVYGIVALILELLKQITWSFNYDNILNLVRWDYPFYIFPFQLCTTPIYVSLICLFLKDNKLRKSLFSYISFVTILGSIATMIMPDSCFVETTLVNIHTMWLHCGSFVLSIYLLMNEVKPTINNFKNSIIVFLIFTIIANFLNIVFYNSGLLNGEEFNMFYISPYFVSTLPVFDIIQKSVPYIIYLIIYLCVIVSGSIIIYNLAILIKSIFKRNKR